jgi:hypothetical protein
MYLRKILPLVYKINKRTRMFSAYLIGGKRDDSSAVRVRYSSGTSEGNVMTREPLAAREVELWLCGYSAKCSAPIAVGAPLRFFAISIARADPTTVRQTPATPTWASYAPG